jgi:hypothetical protein
MANLYRIDDFARLRHWSHIIWDIDGTITEANGEMSQEVAAKIINLGLKGVYQTFITGRDAKWIEDKVIARMASFTNFPLVRDRLIFFAEVGCLMLGIDTNGKVTKTVDPQIARHPLKINKKGIRDDLRGLVYDPDKLAKFKSRSKGETPAEVIYDADGNGYKFDPRNTPPCHPYVWSIQKECFATLEKVRTKEGYVKAFDQTPYVEKVSRAIKLKSFDREVGTEEISTAINIVPRVDGRNLGKSWAAGKALYNIWRNKLGKRINLNQVVAGTVAFGDGRADLDFTKPMFPQDVSGQITQDSLEMIFVGGSQDLPREGEPRYELCKNIIIHATGQGDLAFNWEEDAIHLQPAKGGRVVSEVLDFLKHWDYFSSFG